jgi:WD40 repeat protein
MAGILLATASYDRHIKLWRVNPVDQTRSFNFSQESQVNCLAVSPDRTRLAAAGFMSIKVYDLTVLTGDSASQNHAQAVVSASQENTHTSNVTSIGFVRSVQGAHMLFSTSEDGSWKLWDTKSPVLRLKRGVDVKEPINSGALLLNSFIVCGTQLGTLGVWSFNAPHADPNTRVKNADGLVDSVSIQTDDPAIRSVTLSHGGDLVIAATNCGRVFIFAVSKFVLTGQPQQQQQSQPLARPGSAAGKESEKDGDGSVDALPSQSSAAAPRTPLDVEGDSGADGPAADVELTTEGDASPATTSVSAPPRAQSQEIHNESRLTANTNENKPAAAGQTLVKGGQGYLTLIWSFEAHLRYVLKCTLSPNGSMLCTTSADCTAALWRVPEAVAKLAEEATSGAAPEPRTDKWPLARSITGHQRWVWDGAFSRCGNYVVTASSDHTGRLWHVETGKLEATFAGHQKPVTCIVLDDRRE